MRSINISGTEKRLARINALYTEKSDLEVTTFWFIAAIATITLTIIFTESSKFITLTIGLPLYIAVISLFLNSIKKHIELNNQHLSQLELLIFDEILSANTNNRTHFIDKKLN